MSTLLETDELNVDIGSRRVCRALSIRVETGQRWALLGRNGTGKSTLLLHLAGLRDDAGGVRLHDKGIADWNKRERARRIALLLQHSSRGFGASVMETVLSGRHPHLGRLAWEDKNDLRIAEQCIADVGLGDLAGRSLDTLSGGELRRVEIARTLAQNGDMTLLDEPLNHLDLAHQARVLRVLTERCCGADKALLMVVHDLNVAWQACDHWLLLADEGRWHAGPRAALADPALLSDIFGYPIECINNKDDALFRAKFMS